MKLALGFLFTVLAVQSVIANPAPKLLIFDIFANLSKQIGDTANKVIEESTNIVAGTADIANRIIKGSIETGSNVFKDVIGGAADVFSEGANSLGKVSDSIQDGIKETIDGFTSTFVKNAASSFETLVNRTQQQAEKLLETADEKTADIRKKIDEETLKDKDSVFEFTIEQQSKTSNSSETTQDKVQELLDDFIEKSNTKIDECSDSTVAPSEKLDAKARETIQNSFPLIDAVMKKIKECAKLNQKDFKATSECANEIKEKADSLKPLPRQYADLLMQFAKVSSSQLLRAPCFKTVRSELSKEKEKITKKVEELVKNDNQPENATENNEDKDQSEASKSKDKSTDA